MKEGSSYTITDVLVERIDKDTFKVSWEMADKEANISIYVGESPGRIEHIAPVATVSGESSVRIRLSYTDTRPYFQVVPEGGRGIITAERRVPLEGAVNFRDLGGYETSDGQRVKWGQVFRSDGLSRLTTRDRDVLKGIGIRVVYDFRTPSEVDMAPDQLPDGTGIEYLHLPVVHGEFDSVRAFERIKEGDITWLSKDFMVKGYIRNVEEFGGTWGNVLKGLIKPESRPLVFHCTGGKDRAGVCAAIILLALGVPEDTVVYDHGLSNVYIAELLESVYERIRKVGIDPEKVSPYFTAPRDCILTLLDHIREVYGSISSYLRTKAGISDEEVALFRQGLLE